MFRNYLLRQGTMLAALSLVMILPTMVLLPSVIAQEPELQITVGTDRQRVQPVEGAIQASNEVTIEVSQPEASPDAQETPEIQSEQVQLQPTTEPPTPDVFPTEEPVGIPRLQIASPLVQPPRVTANDAVVVRFELANTDNVTATNVQLELILPDEFNLLSGSVILPEGAYHRDLPDGRLIIEWDNFPEVSPGAAIEVVLPLQVKSGALSGELEIVGSYRSSRQPEDQPKQLSPILVTIFEKPTPIPTEESTTVFSQESTSIPAEKPTLVPTEEPTAAPTEESTFATEVPSPESPKAAEPFLVSLFSTDVVFYGLIVIVGLTAIVLIVVSFIHLFRRKKQTPPSPVQSRTPPPVPPPRPPLPTTAYLECPTRATEPRRIPLRNLDGGGEVIGRAMPETGITLRIDETFPRWETVGRHHAQIFRDPTTRKVVIEDINSKNGVYVQGRRTKRNLLKDGWQVSIGGVEFVYRERQTGSPPTPGNIQQG